MLGILNDDIYLLPLPSMIIVSSLVMISFLQEPKTAKKIKFELLPAGSVESKVIPISSEITVAPVAMAISVILFFLLSPKPKALKNLPYLETCSK